MMYFITLFLLFSSVNLGINATTLSHEEKYFGIEKQWTDSIRDLIEVKRKAFRVLWSQYEDVSRIVPGPSNRSHYLRNFINSYTLALRLLKKWPLMRSLMKVSFGDLLEPPRLQLNANNLRTTSMIALVRLQQTYNLDSETISNGNLLGTYPHTNFSASDCLDVAMFYHQLKHPERTVEWLLAALRRARNDVSVSTQKILEYLYLDFCFEGKSKRSTKTFRALLESNPNFKPTEDLLEDFGFTASTTCQNLGENFNNKLYEDSEAIHYVDNQAGQCRSENYHPPTDRRLRCRLVHYHLAHLMVQPYKMEELHLDPPVLIFYDVIDDKDIQLVKGTYHKRMKYAMRDYYGEDDMYTDLQYNAWLFDHLDNGLPRRINRKATSITNMDRHRCDLTMVASYGLGGELKMHFDVGEDDMLLTGMCTRADYATLMFYLNEVEEGGYTIFPFVNLTVKPTKGAALLFFNRYPDWTELDVMMHSGCPILRGSKWVISKWFYVLNQDFPKCKPEGQKTSYKYFYL